VISTINGDTNVPFYKELANAGIKASDIPVIAFSVGEEELAGVDTKDLVGHLAAWNYFQSMKNPTNDAFINQWHDFIKNPKRVTNDPMEAHYIGFKMLTQAVEQAGTTDVDAVRQAMYGQKVKALSGFVEVMNTNHHLSKPVMIGEPGEQAIRHRLADQRRDQGGRLESLSRRRQGQGCGLDLSLGLRQLYLAEIHELSRPGGGRHARDASAESLCQPLLLDGGGIGRG
jgi:hypothetical protein